ncbi:MAG TPA: AAA family ATPase [Chloroflexota bacterium]|jgi:predicted kinase|nr:AAA family ATPase [Chloroflexota bacterium]
MLENLILVTGAPGSGKSTLAVPLARELRFPLLAKDVIKEALDDALSPSARDLTWSRRLGAATYEVIWAVAPHYRDLVLDCNFYPRNEYQRKKLLELHPRPLELYCSCSAELAMGRQAERASSRHPVHAEIRLSRDRMTDFDTPVALGPVLTVDTTSPCDTSMLVTWIRGRLVHASVHDSDNAVSGGCPDVSLGK